MASRVEPYQQNAFIAKQFAKRNAGGEGLRSGGQRGWPIHAAQRTGIPGKLRRQRYVGYVLAYIELIDGLWILHNLDLWRFAGSNRRHDTGNTHGVQRIPYAV